MPKERRIKTWLNSNKLYLIGVMVGAIAGFLYWQQVGCASGTCLITSKPVNSTVYGAALGALLFGMFKNPTGKQVVNDEDK